MTVGSIEAEVQLVAVDGPLVSRGLPCEHVHVHRGFPFGIDSIRSDQGFGTEHHVDGEEVLGRVVRPCLGKGRYILVHAVPEGGLQLLFGLVKCHGSAVDAPLELVEGGSDHQRNVIGDAGEIRLEGLLEQHFAVRRGAEAPHHRRTRGPGADAGGHGLLAGRDKLAVRHVLHLVHLVRAETQLLHHRAAELLGHGLGVDVEDRTAHDDGLVEQALGGGHAHQCADLAAASGLAEDRDIGRVTAERLDIVPDPLQCLHDVEHADHSGVFVFLAERGEIQESEDVEAVVEAHHDDVLLGEAITGIAGGRAGVEAAAVDPQHHWLAGLCVRRPDIQHAGVLLGHYALGHLTPAVALHHLRPEVVADHHCVPFVHRQGRHEAFNLCIRDAHECHGTILLDTLDQT